MSQWQKTRHFTIVAERISLPENGKLVAEWSEFHLTLNRAHRVFELEIRKKWDILSEKRESGIGDGAKKA